MTFVCGSQCFLPPGENVRGGGGDLHGVLDHLPYYNANNNDKNSHILTTGQWYAPSAVSQSMPEHARVCQSMPEYARVCQSMQEYARVCQGMPEYARVCKSMPEYTRVCQSVPEYPRVC